MCLIRLTLYDIYVYIIRSGYRYILARFMSGWFDRCAKKKRKETIRNDGGAAANLKLKSSVSVHWSSHARVNRYMVHVWSYSRSTATRTVINRNWFSDFLESARNFSAIYSGRSNSDGFCLRFSKSVSQNWRTVDIKGKIMMVFYISKCWLIYSKILVVSLSLLFFLQ